MSYPFIEGRPSPAPNTDWESIRELQDWTLNLRVPNAALRRLTVESIIARSGASTPRQGTRELWECRSHFRDDLEWCRALDIVIPRNVAESYLRKHLCNWTEDELDRIPRDSGASSDWLVISEDDWNTLWEERWPHAEELQDEVEKIIQVMRETEDIRGLFADME